MLKATKHYSLSFGMGRESVDNRRNYCSAILFLSFPWSVPILRISRGELWKWEGNFPPYRYIPWNWRDAKCPNEMSGTLSGARKNCGINQWSVKYLLKSTPSSNYTCWMVCILKKKNGLEGELQHGVKFPSMLSFWPDWESTLNA